MAFTTMVRDCSTGRPRDSAQKNRPKAPATNRIDTNSTRKSSSPVRIGWPLRRGGRRIVPSSVGSKASARPSATAVTMFTHRICIGVIGRVSPSARAPRMVSASPPLVGSVQEITFIRLS